MPIVMPSENQMFNSALMNDFLEKDGKLPLGFFGTEWLLSGWSIFYNSNPFGKPDPLLVSHMRSEWTKGKMLNEITKDTLMENVRLLVKTGITQVSTSDRAKSCPAR